MAMHEAPDISSLLNLATAKPSVGMELRSSFCTILPSVLAKSMPCDLQHLICALLAIREADKVPNSVAEVLLHGCLEFDEKKQVLRLQSHIENPIAAL